MAVKLRLQRHGRGKRPFYHIVATDSRSPRDGKYIERLGDYNPLTKPASIVVNLVTNQLKQLLRCVGPWKKSGIL